LLVVDGGMFVSIQDWDGACKPQFVAKLFKDVDHTLILDEITLQKITIITP